MKNFKAKVVLLKTEKEKVWINCFLFCQKTFSNKLNKTRIIDPAPDRWLSSGKAPYTLVKREMVSQVLLEAYKIQIICSYPLSKSDLKKKVNSDTILGQYPSDFRGRFPTQVANESSLKRLCECLVWNSESIFSWIWSFLSCFGPTPEKSTNFFKM